MTTTTAASLTTIPIPKGGPSPSESQRLLLIDTQELRRAFLQRFLGHHGYTSIVTAESIPAALALPKDQPKFTLILIQLGAGRVAGEPSTEKGLKALRTSMPNVPVMVISDLEDRQDIIRAIELGIRGYLPTSMSEAVALATIKLVEAGGSFAPAHMLFPQSPNGDSDPEPEGSLAAPPERSESSSGNGEPPAGAQGLGDVLSRRQLEVLRLMSMGQPNKVIAYQLCMTESTVKVHVRNIMRKLKVTNRTQAAYLASHLQGILADKPEATPPVPQADLTVGPWIDSPYAQGRNGAATETPNRGASSVSPTATAKSSNVLRPIIEEAPRIREASS